MKKLERIVIDVVPDNKRVEKRRTYSIIVIIKIVTKKNLDIEKNIIQVSVDPSLAGMDIVKDIERVFETEVRNTIIEDLKDIVIVEALRIDLPKRDYPGNGVSWTDIVGKRTEKALVVRDRKEDED